MIVTFGGEKGGSGKSMLCLSVATTLQYMQKRVAILDCDPKPSTATWCLRRQNFYDEFIENPDPAIEAHKKCITRKRVPKPIPFERVRGDIIRTAESMLRDFDYVLIDAGGFDGKEQRTAMILSDLFICPMRPDQFDLDTTSNVNRIFKEANISSRGRLKGVAVISQAPTNPQLLQDIKDAREMMEFELQDMTVARSVIHVRTAFSKSSRFGLSVAEWSDTKARAEIELLCQELFK